MTRQDLLEWIEQIENMKPVFDNLSDQNKSLIDSYQTWLQQAKLKVAPGFNSSIMTPQRLETPKSHDDIDNISTASNKSLPDENINELDKVFGKTHLEDS